VYTLNQYYTTIPGYTVFGLLPLLLLSGSSYSLQPFPKESFHSTSAIMMHIKLQMYTGM